MSNNNLLKTTLSSTSTPSTSVRDPILTPTSTPSDTPRRSSSHSRSSTTPAHSTMDGTDTGKPVVEEVDAQSGQQTTQNSDAPPVVVTPVPTTSKKTKCEKSKHKPAQKEKTKSKKKHKKYESTSESSSDTETEDESDESTSSDESSSEDEKHRKARKKREKKKQKKKQEKKKRSKRKDISSSESDSYDSETSESETESSEDERRRRKHRRGGKSSRRVQSQSGSEYTATEDLDRQDELDEITRQQQLQAQLNAMDLQARGGARRLVPVDPYGNPRPVRLQRIPRPKKKKAAKRASTLEFKRVDQLWDNTIHNYKLTESAEEKFDEFMQYVFTVRRRFDWENKYKDTTVDIKSKLLKEALQEILKDVKGVSLAEDQPSVDPNMLFLYLEELRTYTKKTLKAKLKSEKKRKLKKRIKLTISHCKVLLAYLDQDYEEIKRTLYPMLEAGNITFDLLWALFKPNSIAFTTTYGSVDDPRCFKVDYATREASFMRGEWYSIEGRYLEYDGKSFGLGGFDCDVDAFKGPRKITSLATYPLIYHKDPEGLKKQLIDRGKHFISLEGMQYRFHKGLAFMKKKKAIAKVNINGRIMIDPAIFRRINPNYPISLIKPKELDGVDVDQSDSDVCSCNASGESEAEGVSGGGIAGGEGHDAAAPRTRYKVILDRNRKAQVVEVELDENGLEIQRENIDKLPEGSEGADGDATVTKREFTEEELLIASPVVVGFAFSEKLWLEFSLSGVKDIEWNTGAFESLVLPDNQKSIVKALVESHKFHAAKTIDDVVQGKGKGLVAVLHGSPGTGKTLTAEGIAELLKCPLYMVSAGELGTDPGRLEHELQKILDIAHSWGAVLLLDEADVFLEKRQIHDIHRNALVSIFLRLLEYFQGILFLTTNRVETFDDAFQSRIHVALRYGELNAKAKKSIWRMFLEKVREMEVEAGGDMEVFKEADLDLLARNNLNGRQIKNAVRTAQALAVNEKTKLSMEHIKRVLEVAEMFEQDLKGGSGYKDAMRSYT